MISVILNFNMILLQSMAIINPNQISHLMENQAQFGFHNRSKAYGMDGTFDPFLSSDASAGFIDDKHEITEEERIKAELERKGAIALKVDEQAYHSQPVAKVQKKSVYTSTREIFGTGALSDLVSKGDKDKLVRLEWLLSRFFAPEDAEDSAVMFAEEERPDDAEIIPLVSYIFLFKHARPDSRTAIELLRSILLFLQDGELMPTLSYNTVNTSHYRSHFWAEY